MKHDGKDWVFSSGRKRYASTEMLSIDFEDGKPQICYGYDGGFWDSYELANDWREPKDRLTKDDLIELVDLQIERWQQFKQWLSLQASGSGS